MLETNLTDELLNQAIAESRRDEWAQCIKANDGTMVRVYWFSA